MRTHMTYNLKPTLETERRFEMMEMHLSDTNAVVPKAVCGAETSHDLRDLKGYLEDRLYEVPVGAVCQDCKALAMPLAEVILDDMAQDLEYDGRLGESEDCRQLASKLALETGENRGQG